MSPKSKTQKRNEQRRKNNVNNKSGVKHTPPQHAIMKQLQDTKEQVEALKRHLTTALNQQPATAAAASAPPKVDEKYVKVPDPIDLALARANEAVAAIKSGTGKDYSGVMAAYQKQAQSALDEVAAAVEVRKKLAEADVKDWVVAVEHPDLKTLLRDPFIMAQFKQMFHSVTHNGSLHFGGRRSHYGGRLNNLRTRMSINATINGSSGTAVSTVINVRPAAFSEFSSFQALFDEFKVHGGCLHFNYWATGQTNLVVGNDSAVAYDPVDNSAYASVAGVIVASQHIGPICGVGVTDASLASTAARTAAPTCVSKHGFFQFPFKCPGGPQQVPNNSQQVMTGLWCDTNISSSLGDYGYLKPYFTSAGSTTTTVSYYLVLDVEFRNRT